MTNFSTYGEILIRLATRDFTSLSSAEAYNLYVGGAESNVAVALSQWGMTSRIISAIPDNGLSRKVLSKLRSYEVITDHIALIGDKMGFYMTDEGSGVKPSSVIYDRAKSSFSNHQLETAVVDNSTNNTDWFHWTAITPAVSQNTSDNLSKILNHFDPNETKISADLNYRSKLWKWGKKPHEVIPEMIKSCNVLITTEESVDIMLSQEVSKAPEEIDSTYYDDLTFRLFETYANLEHVFIPVRRTISARNNTITLFGRSREGALRQAPVVNITEMVDRIGAGDAMAAGIINCISKGHEMDETLSFAVMASAFKHAIPGDCIDATEDDIWNVVKGNKAKIDR